MALEMACKYRSMNTNACTCPLSHTYPNQGKTERDMFVIQMKASMYILWLTILESMMAFAMSLPMNLNFAQTSSMMLGLVLGPRGAGNSPAGLWIYWEVVEAPIGRRHRSPRNNMRSERCSSLETRA